MNCDLHESLAPKHTRNDASTSVDVSVLSCPGFAHALHCSSLWWTSQQKQVVRDIFVRTYDCQEVWINVKCTQRTAVCWRHVSALNTKACTDLLAFLTLSQMRQTSSAFRLRAAAQHWHWAVPGCEQLIAPQLLPQACHQVSQLLRGLHGAADQQLEQRG